MSDSMVPLSEFAWSEQQHGVARYIWGHETLQVFARGADRLLILVRNGQEVERIIMPAAAATHIAALLVAPAAPAQGAGPAAQPPPVTGNHSRSAS